MSIDEKTSGNQNINPDSLKQPDKNSSKAMVKILDEKDKIIVSLKESATKRDKLNENQIRILSNDNADKNHEIKTISKKLTEIESTLNKKNSQLNIYKDRTENYGAKLENLKASVDEYRSQISHSLQQVKDMVSVELTKREEKSDRISGLLHDNYNKLEEKISQVDANYKEVISKIAEKQVKAKEFIRKALQDLQEALNLLDINSTGMMIDRKVFDEFSHIINDSGSAFAELNARTKDASTIVKNIENVNIQLSSAPKLDGILKDLSDITTGEYKKPSVADLTRTAQQIPAQKTVPSKDAYRGPAEDDLDSFMAGVSGKSASSGNIPPKKTPAGPAQSIPPVQPSRVEGTPEEKKSPDVNPQAFFAGAPGIGGESTVGKMTFAPGGQAYFAGGPGGLAQPVAGGATITAPKQEVSPDSEQGPSIIGTAIASGVPEEHSTVTSAAPGVQVATTAVLAPPEPTGPAEVEAKISSSESLSIDMYPKGTQSFEAEDDIVTRTSPNLAPYNWDMLPSTSSLLRFRHMLNNAKTAEEKNDYIKALKIYETVQNQKTIQDDPLALHILNDQIEAVNRKARAQISDNVKKSNKLI